MRRPAIAVAVALAVAGCGSTPSPQASDSEPPDQLGHAVLLEAVVPRWGPGPDRELLDDWGENPQLLDKGRTAVVLSRPVAGPGGTWVRAWVAPDPSQFPGDYFAWLPLTQEGRQMLRLEPAPACPAVGTIESVAVLLAPDRLRCFGGGELTVTAKSWLSDWPRYDTDPAWYGTSTGPGEAVALYSQEAEARPPTTAWVDARVPPGVEAPPPDFLLQVIGQFGHPSSDSCHRTLNTAGMNPRPPPGAGLPLESREDSARWCRQQFVLSGWEVMAGPEGRPLDPARPQLHRSPLPPPGVPVACGGVGMPPLRLRIDLDRLDPVWLDVAGGSRSLAFFGPEFLLEVGEEPRITTPGGLVLIDGDVIDPDRGRPGLAVCPGGSVVAFSVPVDQDG